MNDEFRLCSLLRVFLACFSRFLCATPCRKPHRNKEKIKENRCDDDDKRRRQCECGGGVVVEREGPHGRQTKNYHIVIVKLTRAGANEWKSNEMTLRRAAFHSLSVMHSAI